MKTSSARAMFRSPFVVILWVIVTWFVITFLIVPNANLLFETFQPKPGRSAIEKLLSSERAITSLWNSLFLAVALTVTVNVLGIFIVLVTSYFKVIGSRILYLCYATTFVYGGVVLVAAYAYVYGSGGLVENVLGEGLPFLGSNFEGFWPVLFVMTFACTTNHLLFMSSAVEKLDQQTMDSAMMMGASQWRILRQVVLPQLRPSIFATSILTFLTGLGALSAPILIGGRDFQTISPMILTFARTATSRDIAALLALILGLFTVVLLVVMNRIERSGTYFSLSRVSTPLRKVQIVNPVGNAVLHIAAYLVAAVYVFPVLVVLAFSFTPVTLVNNGEFSLTALTLENDVRVFTGDAALRPLLISIAYGLATALTLLVGLVFLTRYLQKFDNWVTQATEYLLHIPWILPSTMIALGLLVTYDRSSPLLGGAVLSGTVFILFVNYVVQKIPFTLRMLKAAFAGVNTSMEEAAALMGASTLTVFRRILLPAVLPVAAAITVLNFSGTLDDYDSAVFLAHPSFQPLGLVIAANTNSETNPAGQSNTFVYTVVLMAISAFTMWLVYGRLLARKGTRGSGGKRGKGGLRAAAATPAASVAPTVGALAAAGASSVSGAPLASGPTAGATPTTNPEGPTP